MQTLPFKLDKKAAIAQLTRYYKGKAFLPKAFKSQNHIAEIQGVYVPFWLYDAKADARGRYEGQNSESHREGDYIVTTTQHYDVRREGSAAFAKVPVEVEYASEFRYRNPVIDAQDVVIAISQSGETADTLAAISLAKERGAFIFGIVHFNPWQFIGAFLLGIVLGVVYYKTKSLLMSIFLHFFNNTIVVVMMKFFYTESFSELLNIPEYLVLLVGIVIFAVFYYLFMYRNRIYYRE